MTATNTGFGDTVANARIDINIRRKSGYGGLRPELVVLEYQDSGGAWVPVDLGEHSGLPADPLRGSVGAPEGFPFPVGAERTVPLRLQISDAGGLGPPCLELACAGPTEVSFEVISVGPATGTPPPEAVPAPGALASVTGTTMLVEEARRPSSITFGSTFANGPVSPHTVRQGSTIVLPSLKPVGPTGFGGKPTGYFEFFIDGVQVKARQSLGELTVLTPEFRLPLSSVTAEIGTGMIDLPLTVAQGAHQVQVRYSGDDRLLPSQASRPFTVVEPVGTAYDCIDPGVSSYYYRAMVEAQANVPRVRPAGVKRPWAT